MMKMEGKNYQTCFDSALNCLEKLQHQMYEFGYEHLRIMELDVELRFLKMFFWGLAYWEDVENDWYMRFAVNTMVPKLSKIANEFVEDRRCVQDNCQCLNWDVVVYDIWEAVHQFIPHACRICLHYVRSDFKCTSCPSNQKKFLEYGRDTASLIDLIRHCVKSLLYGYYKTIAPVTKQQLTLIQCELEELRCFVDPVHRLFDLIPRTRAWSNRISFLTYLYRYIGSNEVWESFMERELSTVLRKEMPRSVSGVISSYFQQTSILQSLPSYLDFVLTDLVIPVKDDIEMVQEGLILLFSFLMEPPQDDSDDREMTWQQIYHVINEFPSLIYSIRTHGEIEREHSKANFSDFLVMVDRVKAKVGKLCVVTPYSSHFSSPSTNVIGFLTSMIINLDKILEKNADMIPSLKHQCELLLKELVSLRPIVGSIMELQQGGHEETKDLLTEIINMVYNVDYIIKLCFPRSFSVWYRIKGLPDVIEHIKFIKYEINKLVGVDKIYKEKVDHHDQMGGTGALSQRGTTSKMEKVFIGFGEIQGSIIDELTRGPKSLSIISISGLPGQGKTTLAKRIFNDPSVQYYFQKCVWCYVSKDCPVKEILVQILSSDTYGELDMKDLVERAWKSLKGRRYLIVLDDIWDVDSWRKLEWSFPDDRNGSRILFTSRNHDLATQAKSNSISHLLPLFTDEDAWELMKKSVFESDDYCEEFVGVGKKIASFCKGLPLAVVLISAVLRKAERKLVVWNKVAENLKLHLAHEGCGKVIELSYSYLPDHLKSCFLYFGVFQRGEIIRAKRLKFLWIGEGFIILDGHMKSSEEDLATKYLKDLVSHSLVVVTEMSSMGEIKKCNVHDLLYDLCLEKGKEEKFSNWAKEIRVVEDNGINAECSMILKFNHHRLQIGTSDTFIMPCPILTKKELPTCPTHSLFWSVRFLYEYSSFLQVLESFKILTVLNLKSIYEFPEMILSMIHLRYLALNFDRSISHIPLAIDNLRSLETLISDFNTDFGFCLLPTSIWTMQSLKHVNIKHAILGREEFDIEFFGASNIETVGTVTLDHYNGSAAAEFLQIFPKLRKLKCRTGNMDIGELFSLVGSLLTQLESLKVSHFNSDEHPYEKKYPLIWNESRIENLKKLSLDGVRLPWSVVSEIGKRLPNLQVLKLLWNSCEGGSWRLEDGDFSKLKYLKFYMLDIEEMDISSCEDNPFPSLEHLSVSCCWKFREIPSFFGEINTLNTIEITFCHNELQHSAMGILEQQRDFGNDDLQIIIKREISFRRRLDY